MQRCDGSTRGPRLTPPQVKAPDIRDGSFHPAELVRRLRAAAVRDRRALGEVQHAPLAPALRRLEYVCAQDDLTAFAGMPALMQCAYARGLADWVDGTPRQRRGDARYSPGKLCAVIVAILAAGLERVAHIDDV